MSKQLFGQLAFIIIKTGFISFEESVQCNAKYISIRGLSLALNPREKVQVLV